MKIEFEIYETVKIKSENVIVYIVSISTDSGTKPPLYFIEKDDKFKIGDFSKDLVWCSREEIEKI